MAKKAKTSKRIEHSSFKDWLKTWPRDWKNKTLWPILTTSWKEVQEAQVPLAASSLAYVTVLSIVPFLVVSFSVFQTFQGLDRLSETIQPLILSHLAENSGREAMAQLEKIIQNIHPKTLGLTGLLALILTCTSMISHIEKAINRIWKVQKKRNWFQRLAAYWFFITLGPLLLAIAYGAMNSTQLGKAPLFPIGTGGFVLTLFFFFWIYKWVPNRKVHWIPAFFGSVFTTLCFNFARQGYSFYVKNVVSYHKIYGSLGAIPIFLLWIYIMWLVILFGATLSASIQKKREYK